MGKYVYPAIFKEEENGQYSVNFPDLHNCFTGADALFDAMVMANDALCLTLYNIEQNGGVIPCATEIRHISVKANEFASYVSCDTEDYVQWFHENQSTDQIP